ncbi:hypothetical protein OFR22_13680 [Brachyspira hyodysenteriae]|uniref:Lipoprotein n=2 Tax=Brachyspira hyodysenteriae TaxID=159 RepID=A0A3B6VAR7_BRAHW|nr:MULTISPECIES: hypothetical protein [Brachyspira]ACN83367.1 hypothetical protein BHWA1_00874 [Brachyspira hyodysenteriae WA1]ANN64491.1 hypothetical protein BHYOB78_11635 [Brachyspira hyodysenteriae ATCC 27164]AUJ49104.1 hypothetical protein BH718_00647 [Brachyspira hyodysenteriae]KLI14640.1 hypothetical protein SU44_09725 [Brachyspira hyodysenteriae]KLI18182.1 hypothetical protein SU45_02485 [Brachyspira hyodysenteriae]
MIKKLSIILISIFIISCNSPFAGAGIKFSNRAGSYQNKDKSITVTITDKSKDNLIIDAVSSETINETITINSSSSSQYLKVNSEKYNGYIYILNLGNNVQNLFLTVRNDKGQNVIFNEKLTILK